LPVRYRIEYKIALITFKALTTQQPQYLLELIRHYEAPRQLRSRGVNILQTSPTVLNFSKRAFCHSSPLVWNNLPQSVISDLTVTTNTFKTGLNVLYTWWPNKNRTFLRYHIFAATTDIITRFLLKCSEITAENNKATIFLKVLNILCKLVKIWCHLVNVSANRL